MTLWRLKELLKDADYVLVEHWDPRYIRMYKRKLIGHIFLRAEHKAILDLGSNGYGFSPLSQISEIKREPITYERACELLKGGSFGVIVEGINIEMEAIRWNSPHKRYELNPRFGNHKWFPLSECYEVTDEPADNTA